jgi:FtsH-binding integral membrane protein
MKELESTKKLLIAESELNRAQLLNEWHAMAHEAHTLVHEAKAFGSLASAVAALVAVLSSFRSKASPAAQRPSRWRTILNGAGLITSLWSAFRPPNHPGKNE